MYLFSDEIDVTQLVSVQKQMKALAADRGIKFSYMPLFIKVFNH